MHLQRPLNTKYEKQMNLSDYPKPWQAYIANVHYEWQAHT